MIAADDAARPNGITTVRIIPHRVAPRAMAPSRSPTGACENTSRMIEVTVGSTTTPTAMPAMNADDVYDDGESGVVDAEERQDRAEVHREPLRRPSSRCAWRKNSAHIA